MRRSVLPVVPMLLLAAAVTLPGQNNRSVSQAGAPNETPTRDPGMKRGMTIADYAKWRTIRDVALSDDGLWATYGYQQRWTDDTLFVKSFATNTEQKIARASRSQFSDDSKWMAYFLAEPVKPADRSGDDTPRNGPARLELRNLATGQTTGWDNVASFAFSKGSAALMIRKARAGQAPDAAAGRGGAGAGAAGGGRGGRGGAGAAPARVDGTDMIVRHLRDGVDELVGDVNAAEFNHNGRVLAYTVSAPSREGNGLYTIATTNWQRRTLDNNRADYTRLTWDDSGSAIAVLRGMDRRGFTERENAVVTVTSVDGDPVTTVLDRKALSGLPDTMVISDKATLQWNPDHSKLFIGLKPQEAQPARRDSSAVVEPVGNVDVWHWKDPVIQPVQMVRAQQDRNRTFLAVVHLAGKHVLPLADARMDRVQVTKDGEWAIGQDDKDYVSDWMPQLNDVYRVNTNTGERTQIVKGQERTLGQSPDGKYLLYWKDKHVWAYDVAANKHTNITAKAPVSFVNVEDDHVGEKPAYGVAGYTKDGKSVVLDHKFDEWIVPLDGSSAPKNLTNGVGSKNEIRFRYVRLDAEENAPASAGAGGFGGRGGGGGASVIDLSKPVLFSAFGETDKKSGYYTLDRDKLAKLVYEDRTFGRPIKAKNADRVLLTRETFVEYPDYWVTDSKFEAPARLTMANPQQAEFKWGHRILFSYKDKDGHPLQGTLAVPDDYKPGEKLPMFVNYYEKYSQNLNHYETPRYSTAPQFVDLVSNGYLVMQPDVYYHTGKSHTDMLNSVEAAVKRVIELGYVDPRKICLQGHSYSGQGSAFIATQSKMFACVLAGAAAVDLIADFNQLWKTSGTNQSRYDIYGQGRFGTNPYDNLELFMDQSAVFHVKTMNTPLLLVQGTNDGSTEWLQGVEFYNALRFNHKPVIFLSYEGEAHGFTRYDNQYDVMTKQKQFLAHYLKGEPAPDWMEHGVPFIKKKPPTGAAAQPVQLIGPGGGLGTPMTGGAGGAAGGGAGSTPPTP